MTSQLRLQVVLPVAVLGLLGLGVGAFAMGRSPALDASPPPPATTADKKQTPPKSTKPTGPKATPLERQLQKHRVVVVLFYAPGDDYDTIQTRETRAGALAAGAGFLALDVTRNAQIAGLAAEYDVRDAPATLVFARGPRVVYRIPGYMDREAVAQAAANGRS